MAEAVSRLNFRGAADVAPENVGVSRSEAILNVNPFAAAAESAEAPARAAPRKIEGYKAFEFAVPPPPANNPYMTVAVWISETPPEDGPFPEKPEEPGEKLLYLRPQVFISEANISLMTSEVSVVVVEERRPPPPPDDVIVGSAIVIEADPDDGMCVSGWTGACAGVGETDCEADGHGPGQPAAAAVGETGRAGAAGGRKQCVLVVTPGLDLEAIHPVYAPRSTILATVADVPVTTAPPSPSTVAATLECAGGTLPAEGGTQAELNLILRAAAERADTAGICAALRRGAEADARYSGNVTPLALVASWNSPGAADAAKLLLANGADPNVPDDTYRWTALHWATRRSPELMRALLAGGAHADVLDKYDWTPLHWAVRVGGADGAARARLLLDGGAYVNMRGVNPELSPLDYADQKGRAAVAAVLRDAGGRCFERMGRLCWEEAVAAAEVCAFDSSLPSNGLTREDWNMTLWAAAGGQNPDAAGICEALRHGADVNMERAQRLPYLPDGRSDIDYHITPLHRVAWERRRNPTPSAVAAAVAAAAVLLRNGAHVDAWTQSERLTPLHRADLVEVADLLLKSGADVNARNLSGDYTPLYGAIGMHDGEERGERWMDMMSLLLRHGADIDARAEYGDERTPLLHEVGKSAPSPAVVKNLLSHGADANARTRDISDYHTPLHKVMFGAEWHDYSDMPERIEIMKALVAGGADVNARFGIYGDDGPALLHYGFDDGPLLFGHSPEALTVLLDLDADVNAKDPEGLTPLHWAILALPSASAQSIPERVMVDNIALLISRGADLTAINYYGAGGGLTPLETAEQIGNLAVVSLIAEATGLQAGQGTVAVTVAVTVAATVVATVAADNGASCPAGSLPANGLTQGRWNVTLMFSAMLRRLQPACDALRRGAYINVRDKEGRRPLYWAANHSDDAMVSLLIENGADVNAAKNGGVAPLHAAAQRSASVVIKLLIDGGANVNLKDSTGKTPLHWSALRRAGLLSGADVVEAAKLLIDGGADVNATDNDGGTPLHTAAGSYVPGYVLVNPLALVRLLLANGAEATVTNDDGETALDIARRLGNSEMVAILAPDENPPDSAPAEEDALADALRKDFAASFNPSPAFGDAFGAVSGSSERFLTRLDSLMRATSGTGGDAWDSFSGWRTENEHGRFWFSTGQRGDFGFGAGGNGAGGDFSASPFAALAGNGMLAGGETGLGADGKLRIAAFADYQAKSLLSGEDRQWTQWAARGTAIETAMTEAERFSGLSENRTRGAMTELHLGGGDLGVALQAGAVSESDSVLSGTARDENLRGLSSRTAFAGLSGAADLFGSGWRLRGSAHLGRSWAESEGLLRDSDLWASAFSAGLERGGWLYSDDGFVLRFSQPLRVESWDMQLIGEQGAGRLGAGSSGRQLDVDAAYRLPLSGGGWLLLSAGVRRDGGHSSSSDLEAGALFSVERGF